MTVEPPSMIRFLHYDWYGTLRVPELSAKRYIRLALLMKIIL
jgi:hypothetical protein